jgi:peptidyl-prolyl cis-trans isomerase D
MLKTMRHNIQSLKSVLWIVVATFIISIFVVWGGGLGSGNQDTAGTIVSVGRERITSESFAAALRNRIEALKQQFKELNKGFIEQLNLPQQVLEQMVEQALIGEMAKAMGLRATDAEVAAKVKGLAGLQRDGQFIGYDEYKRVLDYNHINVAEFEDGIRKDIVLTKTVQLLTAGVTATPAEVWENYQKSKESAKIEYLVLDKTKVELDKKPDPADVRAHFDKAKDAYKIPEKREGGLVFFKNDDLKKEIELGETDIEKYYKDNQAQFQNPERVRVSRIYIPVGKDKDLAQAEAEGVQAKIKAGQDFAALAKIHSKDEKGKDGGDWGPTEWRTLAAKEQDEIARLKAGGVTGIVALDDGFAIDKVTEKDAASTVPLAEAKPRIRSILQDQKARDLAAQRVAKLEKEAKAAKSLDTAAAKANLKVQSTGLLKDGQAFEDIDPSGSIGAALFKLTEKELSGPIYTYGGVGLAELRKTEAPRAAAFDEVKTEVENDVTEARKKDAALAKIKEARAKLADKNWEDVAQKYKLEIKTVDAHKKEQYIGIIGESKEIDALAFSLTLKQVSEPVEFAGGYALVRVLDRKEAVKADFEKEKDTELATLLEQKKNKFLQSYLAKLKTEKGIKIKYDAFLQATQDVLSRYDTGK